MKPPIEPGSRGDISAALQILSGQVPAQAPPPMPFADANVQQRKREATCAARAALAGFRLTRIEADDGRPEWILTRWSLTRAFRDLADLEATLDRIEGRRA